MAETEQKEEPEKLPPAPKPEEERRMLDPDNPLLERFQQALKEHLLRQIDHLKDDIFEYQGGAKQNNARREEIGVKVYEQQQILEMQQKNLTQCVAKLQTTVAAREELDHVLVDKREEYKKDRAKLLDVEAQDMELRRELESVGLLIRQMMLWELTLEGDITVKKRIYEKSRKDKNKLLEQKRSQDALVYKLMMRVWQLEQDLERMDLQLKVKEGEREELAQTAAFGDTNVEAMASEYRCLMHSWNSVVIAIGNRDKVLACLNAEFVKVEEKFKNIHAEIEQVKKLTHKEMKKNEEITVMKNRFAADYQAGKALYDEEMEKQMLLDKRMNDMHAIIEQTELDIQKIEEGSKDNKTLLGSLTREYEQLGKQKAELEEHIIKELAEQFTNNKTVRRLQRGVRQFKGKNREMEVMVANLENKIALVNAEMEGQEFANFELQQYLKELQGQLRDLEKLADGYQEEINQLDFRIAKKQREVDMLNNKYLKMIEKSGVSLTSPLEIKINFLERNIEEVQDQNKKLQQFWLREQADLIKISEQRQDQIHTSSIVRKQIVILEQKNLRVSDDLDANKKQQSGVLRGINNLHSQLTVMGDNFVRTKGLKLGMDKDNEVLRQDYVNKLKDAELEGLQLQDEIARIEEEKVTLSNDLIEMNRQSLEWEKKYLSAKETKSTMQQERGSAGEVGGMRAEIHRMNIRYSQLKKVQDVLIKDLEHCVSRRDVMMTTATARERRITGASEKTRINFARKLDDMKNKMKQMENQTEEMEKKIQKIEREKLETQNEIEMLKSEIERTEDVCRELQDNVEEAITQRQMNFELLLQIQKKLTIYMDLSKGRKPRILYKTENAWAAEYSKATTINSKLSKVVENLQGDFPNRIHQLTRVFNTLKLPVYVYFQ